MPFTIGGNWKSNEKDPQPKKTQLIKVRNVKRKKAILTVIYNIGGKGYDLKEIATTLKKKLGTGGSVKGNDIEIQGHKADEVKTLLKELGIKAQ
ncbi:MAG: hypothetical protein K940chlam3_01718 [Chlamydiae bacterium]|nr:hypothetical protein [Chlamydiota bacterium]